MAAPRFINAHALQQYKIQQYEDSKVKTNVEDVMKKDMTLVASREVLRVQPCLNILYFTERMSRCPCQLSHVMVEIVLNVNNEVTILSNITLSCFRRYTSQIPDRFTSSATTSVVVVVLP